MEGAGNAEASLADAPAAVCPFFLCSLTAGFTVDFTVLLIRRLAFVAGGWFLRYCQFNSVGSDRKAKGLAILDALTLGLCNTSPGLWRWVPRRVNQLLESLAISQIKFNILQDPTETTTGLKIAYEANIAAAEQQRILTEYGRREREIRSDLYARWQPGEIFMLSGRKRIAARMLHKAEVFPKPDHQCLEVGFGSLGWLGDLITWGVKETHLHGIELDPVRASQTQKLLPMADLRLGDATRLPWACNMFQLVIASTVFTSILDRNVRKMVAEEITRVLAPGGALLWYDFAVNNPNNPHVLKVNRKELRQLFPDLSGDIRSVTLAPFLARSVASTSWVAATLLETIPLLRTHLLSVLVKRQ